MQPIHIALEPDLALSTNDFITAWNQTTDCRAVAEAEEREAPPEQFDPLSATAITLLGTVATSLATSALYDLIKLVLTEKNISKKTVMSEVTLPDGTRLVIVKLDDPPK